LGQWELVEKAAEGKLTDIYLARAAGSNAQATAPYAIKILKAEWETDQRAVQTIRREALAGRLVSHPHLVSVLSAGINSPPYYVVMPWLTGATLARILGQDKPPIECEAAKAVGRIANPSYEGSLGAAAALWIARQVADALDALHAARWMHGDVKPSNIFVSPEGHATLLDLGFARRTDRAEPALERCMTGTGHYMAPETLSASPRTDIRSDLYSLGATLYEMLCGEPPVTASTPAELARKHREARPARLDEVAGGLPPDAGLLLRQMLAKQPLRRPQTPREVTDRLVRAEIATLADRSL
jgi:serine/threonine-protein kinase